MNHQEIFELSQSIEWSRLCWDLSWQDIVTLEEILPTIGKTYTVELLWDEIFTDPSSVHFLWRPPHSELNTWEDRPSEIYKSFVIEGEIYKLDKLKCNFKVKKITRLLDIAQKTPISEAFEFPTCGALDGSSFILWEEVQNCTVSQAGSLLYLNGSSYETSYEAIIEIINNDYFLIFHVYGQFPLCCDTLITRKKLIGNDLNVMRKVIEQAKKWKENINIELKPNEVQGAVYY